MRKTVLTLALAAGMMFAPSSAVAAQKGGSFRVGDKTFLLNDKPFVVKAAEVHYPRIPRAYWDQRIKMCKALGMNTLCIYIFWNSHEQQEGVFDFTGNNDIRAFVKLAQANGMWVIVRPGPYVCAEWEMGGLPWWLLKKKDIRLREQDPYFMERLEIFEKKVGEQLGDLTIEKGGPIIMVQVENEYGSYGEDKPYISAVRDCLRKSGFDKVELFQCDWSSNFTKNGLDDLTWTMNFGTGANIDQEFKRLGELRPNSPKMCSEFWSGWFDKWGGRHETRGAEAMVDGISQMLDRGISFSLYMTHGGTNWGHWAGANSPGFAPDVTSYDYDAPINEAGQVTDKFWKLRKAMEKYSGDWDPVAQKWVGSKKLPAVPKEYPTIAIPKFELTEFAPLYNGFDYRYTWWDHEAEAHGNLPKTFEELDMGWGCVLYTTRLPEINDVQVEGVTLHPADRDKWLCTLNLEAHDYAQVFIDGKFIGKLDRVKSEKTLALPAIKQGQELQILVEGMGRINFGRAIKDFKGIIGSPTIKAILRSHLGGVDETIVTFTPNKWECMRIPDDYDVAVKALEEQKTKPTTVEKLNEPVIGRGFRYAKESEDLIFGRGYYRGFFNLSKTGDTFLNLENWGKGQVYVNGHAIGRHWYIGPQQTLYVPGCWLKKGRNEVIVLDIMGPRGERTIEGLQKPIIDKLNLDRPQTHRLEGQTIDLSGEPYVMEGEFKPGNGWQEVKFPQPVSGRYFCIEALNSHMNREYCCIAEWYILGADGTRLSREPWQVAYCDDEDITSGNKTADKIFDLQESTYWSTNRGVQFPHYLIIDLGQDQTFTGFQYLPRVEAGAPESIKKYRIYVKSGAFKM
ncbi:MAG: beta-galactosidase [Bacteroidaceae bacterium]|nr:beta-galactosidase [Bacteroidaceae bacterium]